MTLATLGPVSSNFIVTGFSLVVVLAFVICAVLWIDRFGIFDVEEQAEFTRNEVTVRLDRDIVGDDR